MGVEGVSFAGAQDVTTGESSRSSGTTEVTERGGPAEGIRHTGIDGSETCTVGAPAMLTPCTKPWAAGRS